MMNCSIRGGVTNRLRIDQALEDDRFTLSNNIAVSHIELLVIIGVNSSVFCSPQCNVVAAALNPVHITR